MEWISQSVEDTEKLARALSARLEPGDVLFLDGDLGMGKSVFARALIRSLTGEPELDVPSPTFTLVQVYDAPPCRIWHFDLYRIKAPDEIWELGWEDALGADIILAEWPSRLDPGLAPANRLALGFAPDYDRLQPEKRVITLTPHGHWKQRLL